MEENTITSKMKELQENNQEFDESAVSCTSDYDCEEGVCEDECLEENQMVLTKTRGEVMLKHLISGEHIKTCDGDWTTFLYNDHQNKYGVNQKEPVEFYSF